MAPLFWSLEMLAVAEAPTDAPLSPALLEKMNAYWRALDAVSRIPRFADQVEAAKARYWTAMERHKLYISEHGEDMPEVADGRWTS
jgi:xylulose-5-phosphate/fructose-6-phosphate phosphoketolase